MLAPEDELVFDTVLSIRVGWPADITELPVESGSLATDHIQLRGRPLHIRGVVSATPTSDEEGTPDDPRALALAWFERNREAVVEAITPAGTFRDLLMGDIPFEYTQSQRYVFDVQLTEVRFVSPVSVPIPPRLPAGRVAAGMASEQDAGITTTTEVEENRRPAASLSWDALQMSASAFEGLKGLMSGGL